jgi:hypothetical protein
MIPSWLEWFRFIALISTFIVGPYPGNIYQSSVFLIVAAYLITQGFYNRKTIRNKGEIA